MRTQQHRLGGGTKITASSPSMPASTQPHQQQNNNKNNDLNNEFIQRQILTEIQRFESVHPCIYRIYDLLDKIDDDNDKLANAIRQQVINIEDAFVNSQEWTLSRTINELRLGVVGSEDSCKNSLIHYFLTRNWNWEDAPEGGRFKKEVAVDGRSFLLLIRDEGSREPNLQFSQWLDALLVVFTLDSRQSFQYALEMKQIVNNLRRLDVVDVPVYLIGMKNMSNMGLQRLISEEEAYRTTKAYKMCNYFECLDGSSVQRMFNNVCQRVVQQRQSTRASSFIGQPNIMGCGLLQQQESVDPMLTSISSSSAFPTAVPRPSSYHHQRSISVLPINNEHCGGSSSFASSQHHQNLPSGRGRTPRYEELPSQQHQHPSQFYPPPVLNFRQQQPPSHPLSSSTSFTPNHLPERDSLDWQHRPIAGASATAKPFAIPSTPSSCSTLVLGSTGRNNNPNGEQLAALSPAYSQNSLSSSHYQLSASAGPNSGMSASPAPSYSRTSSNMVVVPQPNHSFGRPCSDPPGSQCPAAGQFNDCGFFDCHQQQQLGGGGGGQPAHPLSNSSATSSSTLVVANNGNGSNMLPTPGNTPKTDRKGKRISNIFRKDPPPATTPDERIAKSSAEINMGIGRAIPIRQGQLYKRSKNGLNKEWKKKFVCLYPDGRICYHQNLKDYMDKDSRGKEIYLGLATVRTSDRHKPRGGASGGNNRNSMLPVQQGKEFQQAAGGSGGWPQDRSNEAYEAEDYLKSPTGELSEGVSDSCGGETATGGLVTSTSSGVFVGGSGEKEKSSGKKEKHKEKKKRAKRMGSSAKNDEEEDSCEFEIVSCDQKRWEFSASSVEERDQWVASIEREIEKCLQQQLSLKDQQQLNGARNGQAGGLGALTPGIAGAGNTESRRAAIQALRHIEGNDLCADCSAAHPDWASINLGILICIECSGIHRKLGSHISKVRSLELDDWPPEHLVVMRVIGNRLANQVWEHNASPKDKPAPESPREQKEQWIRMKYEERLYLPPIPVDRTLSQQLVDAVLARNIQQLLTVLPRCSKADVNAPIGGQNDRRTAVHLACGIGALEILQLLIWYNADIQALDEQARSALWHAQVNGASECVALLLQAGLRAEGDGSGTSSGGGGNRRSQLLTCEHRL